MLGWARRSRGSTPRFLALGHVTRDRREAGDVLGGTVSYAALAAQKLGWDAAILTAAGPDFDPARELPGIACFCAPSAATTRFVNIYDERGGRRQTLAARAADVDLERLPDAWRGPDVLLLAPVAGELAAGTGTAFMADVVGATAQGWLRAFDEDGAVSARAFADAAGALAGVHVVFLSEDDLDDAAARASELLGSVPIVALTRGWRGSTLLTRQGACDVPSLPCHEVDATGAGDVFAAAFLVRYHEIKDTLEAAAFASCAASCVVEAVGVAGIAGRDEVVKRLALRERFLEEGDWDE
jgi:sugar/nucleoside kinase (ribokinase family)